MLMDIYEAIMERRDIRRFKSQPIRSDVLARILNAAHHAPSVGYSQPWNFIIIQDIEIRKKIKELFNEERRKFREKLSGNRQTLFDSLKLEGITDAPINIAITCDRNRFGPTILGASSMPETSVYSSVLAVGNLWLAARSEGVGVGWVSIFDRENVKKVLRIPENIELIAYLCVGYVEEFPDKPELEEMGWNKRTDLSELVFEDKWGAEIDTELKKQIEAIKG